MAGLEPATTRLQGEVTVIYATGQTKLCAHQGTIEASFQSEGSTEPCQSGQRPRPEESLLRQRFRSARSLAEEVTRLFTTEFLFGSRRFAIARESASCQGTSPHGVWESNPTLSGFPEVSMQYATDRKLAEGSSENRALVLSQRKYLSSSPLSYYLLCGWICVGSSAYNNAQVTRSARRSPQR